MTAVGTRLLVLTINGTAYDEESSTAKVTSGDADTDFLTFADARRGGSRQYNLEFTGVQDMAAGTLWDLMWTAPGTEVPFIIKPYGDIPATATQPWLSGTAVVSEPDGDLVGGDADVSTTARMTFSVVWKCTAKPVRVTS